MNFSRGHRFGKDPMLLWLWCRLSAAAMIQPLAQELPYVMGTTLKSKIIINKKNKIKSATESKREKWKDKNNERGIESGYKGLI